MEPVSAVRIQPIRPTIPAPFICMPAPPFPAYETARSHARSNASRAFVPYSGEDVAVAVVLSSGEWVPGVRVESASFPLTIGAAMNGITTAVALGRRDIVAVVASRPLQPYDGLYLEELGFADLSAAGPDVWIAPEARSLESIEEMPLDPVVSEQPGSVAAGVSASREVASRAFVPASSFLVGTLLEIEEGGLVPGVNVEHPDWGRILCAERNALGTAVSYGLSPAGALYLSCPSDPEGTPCGACRQLLLERASSSVIWMDRGTDAPERSSPASLLPGGFTGETLPRQTASL